jgi:hypothetical protein
MIFHFTTFILFVSLFLRQTSVDAKRAYNKYLERDRLGDEHIMREIEKFKKKKGID